MECINRCLTLPVQLGDGIAFPDYSLNRRALADIVFADGGKEKRELLNRITHAHILVQTKRIADQYAAEGAPAVLIDAPLLFESGFDAECSCTVCVIASEEASVTRILKRDGITEAEARRRLGAQISAEELVRRCDYVIENDLNCETLDEQVANVVSDILARFKAEEVPRERKD